VQWQNECCLGRDRAHPTTILQTLTELREKCNWLYPGRSQLLIRQLTCVKVGTQVSVSKVLAYNSIWKKKKCTTRERCQLLKPKKLSINGTDLTERSGAYNTLYFSFFMWQLSMLAGFPKQSPKLIFVLSALTLQIFLNF